jgi:hypothetical protein
MGSHARADTAADCASGVGGVAGGRPTPLHAMGHVDIVTMPLALPAQAYQLGFEVRQAGFQGGTVSQVVTNLDLMEHAGPLE